MKASSEKAIEKEFKTIDKKFKTTAKEVEKLKKGMAEHTTAIGELMDNGITIMRSIKKFYGEQQEMYEMLKNIQKDIKEIKDEKKEYEKDFSKKEGYM